MTEEAYDLEENKVESEDHDLNDIISKSGRNIAIWIYRWEYIT